MKVSRNRHSLKSQRKHHRKVSKTVSKSVSKKSPSKKRKRSSTIKEDNRLLYKKWQRYSIEYMTKNCVNQNGLLLYHQMGTGKTLTSLGIAANLGNPIVIIAPSGLVSQWQNDYIKKYKHYLPEISLLTSYENCWSLLASKNEAWRSRHTIIIDEAHNLSEWLGRKIDIKKRLKSINYLFQFKKRILLTGTPVYYSEQDLRFIINVAAGYSIMPLDNEEFIRKYYYKNYFKSAIFGWVVPLFKDIPHFFTKFASIAAISGSVFIFSQLFIAIYSGNDNSLFDNLIYYLLLAFQYLSYGVTKIGNPVMEQGVKIMRVPIKALFKMLGWYYNIDNKELDPFLNMIKTGNEINEEIVRPFAKKIDPNNIGIDKIRENIDKIPINLDDMNIPSLLKKQKEVI